MGVIKKANVIISEEKYVIKTVIPNDEMRKPNEKKQQQKSEAERQRLAIKEAEAERQRLAVQAEAGRQRLAIQAEAERQRLATERRNISIQSDIRSYEEMIAFERRELDKLRAERSQHFQMFGAMARDDYNLDMINYHQNNWYQYSKKIQELKNKL